MSATRASKKVIQHTQAKPIKERYYIIPILILTAIVLSPCLKNEFVSWDDLEYIANNTFIHSLSFSNISGIFTSFYAANYHPFTTLSWAVEYKLVGAAPFLYHADNILLHLINTLLVFLFTRKLLTNVEIAVFVTVLFGIHPMHVESVAWASERKDVLYTFFYVAAMITYLHFIDTKNVKWLVYTFVLFVCSCFSKSAAITLPLLLLLLDYYKDRLHWKAVLAKIPFIAIAIVFGILAIQSQKATHAVNLEILQISGFDRFFFICFSGLYYLLTFFVPTHLSAMHPYPHPQQGLPLLYFLSPFLIIALVLLPVFWKKYRKELIFGAVFYAIGLSLVIQLVPLGESMVSERYAYVPYIGLAIAFGSIIYKQLYQNATRVRKQTITAVFVLSILVFASLSYQRCTMWKTSETLFGDVIEKYPNESCGYQLRSFSRIQVNDIPGALDDCNKGLAIQPMLQVLLYNRGVVRYKLNDLKGAISDYSKVIEQNPNDFNSIFNRAAAESDVQDYKGALTDYNKAMQLNPDFVDIYVSRSLVKFRMADYAGALQDLQQPIPQNAHNADVFFNIGNAYFMQNKYPDALQNYSKAITLNPNCDKAICNRGNIFSMMGEKDKACIDWAKATELGNSLAKQNYAQCK